MIFPALSSATTMSPFEATARPNGVIKFPPDEIFVMAPVARLTRATPLTPPPPGPPYETTRSPDAATAIPLKLKNGAAPTAIVVAAPFPGSTRKMPPVPAPNALPSATMMSPGCRVTALTTGGRRTKQITVAASTRIRLMNDPPSRDFRYGPCSLRCHVADRAATCPPTCSAHSPYVTRTVAFSKASSA